MSLNWRDFRIQQFNEAQRACMKVCLLYVRWQCSQWPICLCSATPDLQAHAESALHLIICETLTWLEPHSQAYPLQHRHTWLWTWRCVCLCDCTNIENNKMDKHNCSTPIAAHYPVTSFSSRHPARHSVQYTYTHRHNNILQEYNKEFLIRSHMVFPGLYSPFFVCKRYEYFVYKKP